MRMIFVNLPVKDLSASKAFFTELGFEFHPQYSDDNAACMVIDQNIFAMLLTEEFFRGFINGEIADAGTSEVLTCITYDSKDAITETVRRAIAAGGRPWKPLMDEGAMYGWSFQDLDGHVWELLYMPPR